MRAALSWACEVGNPEVAMRLGMALWRFWHMRGYLAEGIERVQQALALPDSHAHPELRANALMAAAGLAYWQADIDRAGALYEEEIAARRALEDRAGLAEALYGVSFVLLMSRVKGRDEQDAARAQASAGEALEIFTEIGDEGGTGRAEWAMALIARGLGQLAEARDHAEHALEIFERIGDRFMIGWVSHTFAEVQLAEDLKLDGGSPELRTKARDWLLRALRIFAEAQDVSGYTLVLDALAVVAYRDGMLPRAARLSGAVATFEATSGTGLNTWNRGLLGFRPELLRDDPKLAEEWAAGERMGADEAVAYALED